MIFMNTFKFIWNFKMILKKMLEQIFEAITGILFVKLFGKYLSVI